MSEEVIDENDIKFLSKLQFRASASVRAPARKVGRRPNIAFFGGTGLQFRKKSIQFLPERECKVKIGKA